jgi:serpin B
LTNAIYFKGDWAHPFQQEMTKTADFHVTAGQKVPAPMMQQTREFSYHAGDGFQILEMPYSGDALSMVIFLPEKVDGLAAFEQTLRADKVSAWLSNLRQRKVQVALPKFRMTAEFQLQDALSALGMPTAFTERADFSGMDGKEDLYLSAVVHKAFVDVNEQGTEAAAATGVVVGAMAAPPTAIPVFRADHPFLFLIRDKRSGSLLFLGRVLDPTK